jgi:hypothetical protein
MRALPIGALGLALVAAVAAPASAHGAGVDDEGRAIRPQLAELRRATSDFRHGPGGGWTTKVVDLAGISCIEDPAGTGAMGIHYVDVDNLGDGSISRLRPEALIYEPGRHGRLKLVAAEYLVIAAAWDATHDAPPRLYGRSFEFVDAGNRYGLPAFYELHVWHEKSNPNGLMEDWNPRVHCD